MGKTLREMVEDRAAEINSSEELDRNVIIKNSLIDEALSFVSMMKQKVRRDVGIELGDPYPSVLCDGSIDFEFNGEDYMLLLNVGNSRAGYYGEFKNGRVPKIKGELN